MTEITAAEMAALPEGVFVRLDLPNKTRVKLINGGGSIRLYAPYPLVAQTHWVEDGEAVVYSHQVPYRYLILPMDKIRRIELMTPAEVIV